MEAKTTEHKVESTILETDPISGYKKERVAIPTLRSETITEEFTGEKTVAYRYRFIGPGPNTWISLGLRKIDGGNDVNLSLAEDNSFIIGLLSPPTAYYTTDGRINSIRVFCYAKIDSKSTGKKIILREEDISVADDSLMKKKSKSQIFPYNKPFKLVDNLFVVERNSGLVILTQEPPKQEPPVFTSLSLVLPEHIGLEHIQKARSPGREWRSFFSDTGIKAEIKH